MLSGPGAGAGATGPGDGAGVADARERARARRWRPSVERVEVLVTMSEIFASADPAGDELLRESAVAVSEILGDAVVIDLLTEDLAWLLPTGAHHPDPRVRRLLGEVIGHRFPADEGFTACALDTGSTLLVPLVTELELEALQPGLAPVCAEIGLRGFVLSPMQVRGRCVGLVALARTREEPRLDDDDARFLAEVAMRLAIQIAG
jgi:GAF domain-containing protein